ncbi:MAG: 16S rRNA (cytosine(967)-C(5))-methyltransferase RsmB [Ruminococcaceae bacterium]|nr:16S rRNA (cytosine(967)-C(5))-methyltransferase RsmB [Oscillospiraceae bacterium]
MPTPKPNNARRAAVAALARLHKGGWPNMALNSALAAQSLDPRDKAFASALFLGAAERLFTLDWLLQPHLRKPIARLDVEVRAILEAGLYQLLWMRVPPSAAVNESVKLARAFGKSSAAGLVNAVLRKLAPQANAGEAAKNKPIGPDFSTYTFKDETERVMVTWSVGEAVAKAVMAALPEAYDAYFAASFSTGELCLRTNTLKTTPAELAARLEAGGAAVRGGLLPETLYARLPGGVAEEPLFEAGLYHVQGEASQIACACLGPQPGDKVLDLCAAPGGKSATLAEMMQPPNTTTPPGAGLTACDLRENRLPLITQAFARLGITGAQVLQNDGTVYNAALAGCQRVLCDVPCSSLGVLAGKPDLRTANGDNFDTLPEIQMKLLSTAARYVTMGGKLVYATCTIRAAENAGVVRRFLAETPGFALVPPPVAPKGALLRDNMMTLLPHRTATDGFFVATMERLW